MVDQLVVFLTSRAGRHQRYFLATFCWDAGVIALDAPLDIDVAAMRIKVYKALHRFGLSAVCVIEVVALRKSKHNDEALLIHVHAVCWTADKSFKPVKAAKTLMQVGSFPNKFGAPSVSFQSRAMAANRFRDKTSEMFKHLFSKLSQWGVTGKDQTKRSMAWLGQYLFQAPAWMKHIVPKAERADGLAMRSCDRNYSPNLASALLETLAAIQVTDAVFSVRDGKSVLGPWRIRYRKALARIEVAAMKKRRARR